MVPNAQNRILGLSFEKEIAENAFFEFEKQVVFGVFQLLKYFSPLEFIDCAIPSHRKMMNRPFLQDKDLPELHRLASQFESHYILYGSLEPEVGPTGYMDGIQIEVCLYDFRRNRHSLHLDYYFSSFTDLRVEPSRFEPSWDGLNELVYWLAFQVVGAIYGDQLVLFTKMSQSLPLANNCEQFRRLSSAYYLNTDGALSQKLSSLFGLTQEAPELFLAHLELGSLYKRLNSYGEALSSFLTAYKLMTNVMPRQAATCATEIGICCALLQQTEKACEWWNMAIYVDPTFLNPYMNLAHCREEEGSIEEAEQLFNKAAEIEPSDSRVYFNLARLYSKLENWDKVIEQYEQQLLLEPDNPWVYSNLANCYLQKGEIGQARSFLLKTFELDPHGEAGKTASFILENLKSAEV